ncbi:MAG: ferritin family protein [Bacteroidales bacterium]|nr:ferritin family protein [Bacteroidales bacterium]
MKTFKNVDAILLFAMEQEQKAVDFYTELAREAHSEEMKKVFIEFAGEEIKHKQRLTRIREEGVFTMPTEKVADLKIGDYMVEVKASGKLSYEEALVLAMKREKAAFRLYTTLAERAPNEQLREVFQSLAMEESRHKLRFELEYDEYVLREN